MEKLKDECVKNLSNDMVLEQNLSTCDIDDDATLIEDELETVIKTAICLLKEYGASKGLSLHSITQMPPIQLADYLKDFYSSYKPTEGKHLSQCRAYLRTGLHKYFQKNQGIDIINDSEFHSANSIIVPQNKNRFSRRPQSQRLADSESDGANGTLEPHMNPKFSRKGQRLNALRMEFEDLKKIYMGPAMNLEQPDTLQNKVFFDVNVYICNRGKDFLRVMCKSDFDVAVDSDGRKYVWLKYRSKFSFKELVGGLNDNDPVICGNQIGARMYERIGDPKCPVASFVQYISHLHPMTDAFWQRPKRNFVATDYVWYDNTPLGNSTISKIMTRTCQMSGLFENYTNHTIKSSYIHILEKICSDAVKEARLLEAPKSCASPVITSRQQLSVDESSATEVSSITSDSRDKETEYCDDEKVGLRQAKMKVLEMVHGLEVRDIRSFVDWLKTFRVEYDGGGLMVMCSPVDQKLEPKLEQKEEKNVEDKEKSSIPNGEKKREVSPTPPVRNRQLSPAPQFFRNQIPHERDHLKLLSRHESLEKIPESRPCDFGIAIRQLEFETVSGVKFSAADISPIKVTVPAQDTVLLTGLQDSVQLLLHNRKGPPMSSEPLHSRIFYSQHEMDVAVVTALLSTRNSLKSSCVSEKTDNSCKLQDKFKPVKKRSLTDIHAGFAQDDFEIPAKKQFIPTSNPGTFIEYTPRYNNSSQNKPTSIYHVPVTARSNLVEQSSGSTPMLIQENNPSLVVNYHNKSPTAGMNLMYQIEVKKEPTDLE